MKTSHILALTGLCCLISACARDKREAAPIFTPITNSTASFSVTAQGTPALTYQWYKDTNASAATTTFVITNPGTAPLNYQWYFNTNVSRATNQ